jgi:hypothetical protein
MTYTEEMTNDERWYNLLRGFLDKDFAQELDVIVPEYSEKIGNTEIPQIPRHELFTQEAIVMMQLIRELREVNKSLKGRP